MSSSRNTFWAPLLALGMAAPLVAAPLRIVTTTSDLAALARAVAGEAAEVRSLCTGREDPHMLQAKPGFILAARDADLWIRAGMELEIGWEKPILDGSRNTRIRIGTRGHLDASEQVLKRELPQTPVTRAMGDVHPSGNPHYWLDPYNGRRIAAAIAERLAELAPAEGERFRANAATFQRALDERMFGTAAVQTFGAEALWAKTGDPSWAAFAQDLASRKLIGGWSATLLPLHGKKIITYHKSWIYLAGRFGLEVIAELEPVPGVPPTAAHLKQVAATAQAQGVALILQEPFYNVKAGKQVAAACGARFVAVANSVGGHPEAVDYLALMELIVTRLAQP